MQCVCPGYKSFPSFQSLTWDQSLMFSQMDWFWQIFQVLSHPCTRCLSWDAIWHQIRIINFPAHWSLFSLSRNSTEAPSAVHCSEWQKAHLRAWKESLIGLFWPALLSKPALIHTNLCLTQMSLCSFPQVLSIQKSCISRLCAVDIQPCVWGHCVAWLMIVWALPARLSAAEFLWYVVFLSKHNSVYFSPESSTFVLSARTASKWSSAVECLGGLLTDSSMFWSSVASCAVFSLDSAGFVNYQEIRKTPEHTHYFWSSDNFVNKKHD